MKLMIVLLCFGNLTPTGFSQDTLTASQKTKFSIEKYYGSTHFSKEQVHLTLNLGDNRNFLYSIGYNSSRIETPKSKSLYISYHNPPVKYIYNFFLSAGKRIDFNKRLAFSLQGGATFVHFIKPENIQTETVTTTGFWFFPGRTDITYTYQNKHYYLPGGNLNGKFYFNLTKNISFDLGFAFYADKFNQNFAITFGASIGKVR
ncbi:MAG: hypothetical protein ACOZCO_10010 [Bacteroidota bacterium]